jgi:hypothetical protein
MNPIASMKSTPKYKTPSKAATTIFATLYNTRAAAEKDAQVASCANNNAPSTSALQNARAADQKCSEAALHADQKYGEAALYANTNVANRNPTETSAKTVLQTSRTSGEVVVIQDTTPPTPHDEHAAPRELEQERTRKR